MLICRVFCLKTKPLNENFRVKTYLHIFVLLPVNKAIWQRDTKIISYC